MLKIAIHPEERRGSELMAWWSGDGAAEVLAADGDALLIERATGSGSLVAMAQSARDDDATRIICAVATTLHAPRTTPLPDLVPLDHWFRELWPAAGKHGGVLARSAEVARGLLAEPRDRTVLHGDLHHGNVLDFGDRGWLAIDPKGLIGERGFDFASLFCNPDYAVATSFGRLACQADIVVAEAGLDRDRLVRWTLAYAGLSAAWSLASGADPRIALAVAEIACTELGWRFRAHI